MRIRRVTRLRRGVVATVAATTLLSGLSALPAEAHRPRSNNVVKVRTTTDGAFKARARVRATAFRGRSVGPTNLALARAVDCTGCRSRAAALQAVFITGNPRSVTPTNLAVAVNTNCIRCEVYAFAFQYVVSPEHPVRLTHEGRRRLRDIQARAREAVAQDAPLADIDRTLQGLAAELKQVVDTELRETRRGADTRWVVNRDMSDGLAVPHARMDSSRLRNYHSMTTGPRRVHEQIPR